MPDYFFCSLIALLQPSGVSSKWVLLDTTLLNAYFIRKAWKFYCTGTPDDARWLFLTSLWQLPAAMALLILHHYY